MDTTYRDLATLLFICVYNPVVNIALGRQRQRIVKILAIQVRDRVAVPRSRCPHQPGACSIASQTVAAMAGLKPKMRYSRGSDDVKERRERTRARRVEQVYMASPNLGYAEGQRRKECCTAPRTWR